MKKIIALLVFSAFFMNAFAQYERYSLASTENGKYFGTTPDGKEWYVVWDRKKDGNRNFGLEIDGKLIIPIGTYWRIVGLTHKGKQYFEASIKNPYTNDIERYSSFPENYLYDQYGKVVYKYFMPFHLWRPQDKYFEISLDEQTKGLIDRNLNMVMRFSL